MRASDVPVEIQTDHVPITNRSLAARYNHMNEFRLCKTGFSYPVPYPSLKHVPPITVQLPFLYKWEEEEK
jgi:hypothetical protein